MCSCLLQLRKYSVNLGENSFYYFKMITATLKSYQETIGMSYLSAIELVTIIKESYRHVVSLRSDKLSFSEYLCNQPVAMSDTF